MSSTFIYLSYFLNSETPLYGGAKGISITLDKDISKGDTANTKQLGMHNHSGTHIDFPNHFFAEGKTSSDYNADFWVFEHPFVITLEAQENDIISLTEAQLAGIPEQTDFLILNTGFYKYRTQEKFWKHNPGISSDMAKRLRRQCQGLRVLGMDCISLTSFQNRELGREAHREFLGEHQILLVEDMNLMLLEGIPDKVMCFPLMVEGIDGAPVSIIAEYK